jgi:regulator of sigma E protease
MLGDRIVEIDGRPVDQFEDIDRPLVSRAATQVAVMRQGRKTVLTLSAPKDLNTETAGYGHQHSLSGLLSMRRPLLFRLIKNVNGLPVAGEDEARAALGPLLGRTITLTLESNDKTLHVFTVRPPRVANAGLTDEDRDGVYLGDRDDRIYTRRSFAQAALGGLDTTGAFIGRVFEVSLRHIGVFENHILPEIMVSGSETGRLKSVHMFLDITALMSIFVALMNLLPLPGLDGYFLMKYGLEIAAGTQRAEKIHAYAWRISLLLFAIVFVFCKIGLWSVI